MINPTILISIIITLIVCIILGWTYHSIVIKRDMTKKSIARTTLSEDIKYIKKQLDELDSKLPRCVEDLISVQCIDETQLPKIMQDRLNEKRNLRNKISK